MSFFLCFWLGKTVLRLGVLGVIIQITITTFME